MKRKQPLQDGWSCPNCGQTSGRHGRGGARGCKHEPQGPTCPGLVCKCRDGQCFSHEYGYGWRRSPCPNAFCHHCGWRGSVRSREFERAYGHSRCPISMDGWHFAVLKLKISKDRSGKYQLVFVCKLCGAKGTFALDPVRDIPWSFPERTAPPDGSAHEHRRDEVPRAEDTSRGVTK